MEATYIDAQHIQQNFTWRHKKYDFISPRFRKDFLELSASTRNRSITLKCSNGEWKTKRLHTYLQYLLQLEEYIYSEGGLKKIEFEEIEIFLEIYSDIYENTYIILQEMQNKYVNTLLVRAYNTSQLILSWEILRVFLIEFENNELGKKIKREVLLLVGILPISKVVKSRLRRRLCKILTHLELNNKNRITIYQYMQEIKKLFDLFSYLHTLTTNSLIERGKLPTRNIQTFIAQKKTLETQANILQSKGLEIICEYMQLHTKTFLHNEQGIRLISW